MKKLVKPTRIYKVQNGKRLLDRGKSCRDEHGTLAEFRLMSRRPGLASGIIGDFVALWQSNAAFRHALTVNGDVPSVIRHQGKTMFLDRFLKSKLRDALGIEVDITPFLEDIRRQFFDWLHNVAPKQGDFVDYLVAQDDQKYKQLKDRIKRQLQKRAKI